MLIIPIRDKIFVFDLILGILEWDLNETSPHMTLNYENAYLIPGESYCFFRVPATQFLNVARHI